jgi:hypothetical protein
MWVGYHIDGWDRSKSIPIALGETKDEALGLAIQRVLGLGITDGEVGAEDKTGTLTDEEFLKLGEVLEAFAAKHGLRLAS